MTEHLTSKERAIEHAEYLATGVEHYLKARAAHDALLEAEETDPRRLMDAAEAVSDHWIGLQRLVHEFRKRAVRAAEPPTAIQFELRNEFEVPGICKHCGECMDSHDVVSRWLCRPSETKSAECGACDKPGEHCSNQYGICSRHGGRSHETPASLADEDGPGEEDGLWADGWSERSGR